MVAAASEETAMSVDPAAVEEALADLLEYEITGVWVFSSPSPFVSLMPTTATDAAPNAVRASLRIGEQQ
jgi:hypothetical protein